MVGRGISRVSVSAGGVVCQFPCSECGGWEGSAGGFHFQCECGWAGSGFKNK